MKELVLVLALIGTLSLISVASAQLNSSQTWGSFGNGIGQFYGLSGVAADTSGNIYVAELDNRVQKFSVSGSYITQFNIPARSIVIDSSGNIYATVNDSIQKFNSTGTLLNTWGSTGSGNGYFNFPTGIALDSLGNIYVSDTENNRIQKLDSSGNYVTSWGTLGSGNGNFKSPAGVFVSGNYVYVADMGNYRVQEFDLNGNYLSSLGSKGTGNNQFNSSIAVANDSSGNIYVADYYNGRALEYDSNFNYLTQYTGLSYPTALVVANNNLYILDSGNYQVYEYYNGTTNRLTPTITWSNPTDISYSTALSITQLNAVATDPITGNPVTGNFVYIPAAGTVLSAGARTLHTNFKPNDIANYTTASKDVTINVSRITPTTTWSNPVAINYGTALSGAQLNASASVPGSFAYNPVFGTIMGAGTHILNTTFTPTDSVNYTTATIIVSLTVNKSTPLITWSNPANITNGTALSVTQLNANASVPGSFVYTPASGTILSEGTHTLRVDFTPTDTVNYTTASKDITINVSKVTPTITWSNPVAITYGTALSGDQLNAVATDPVTGNTVTGNFVYNPAAGTILSAGARTLHADFTPTDTVNYTTASKDITINVSKVTPTITWSNPVAITYGTALSGDQLNAVATDPITGNTVTGNFVYNPAAGTILSAGSQTLHANFTPNDIANCTNATADVTITVNSTIVTNGLVVYYDGSLSGNSLVDLSGNNNIGYATSVTPGTNQSTGAHYINLNGVNSKIDVSNNVQTNISSPISIEFIGSINEFKKYGSLVSKYRSSTGGGWYLSCSPIPPYNKALFSAVLNRGTQEGYNSNVILAAGQVYDIVATYDNNVTHIYVNGVDSGTYTWNSPIKGNTNNITIGSGSYLNYSNCSMYAFRLYNRSLSPAEVKKNYEYDRWRYIPQAPTDDISMIKKLVYGDGGLPRYMGSYAIQQSVYGLDILDNNLNIYNSIGTPFFQNKGGSLTNCSLAGTMINGIKWRNYYAAGSSAILTYTGNNRSVQDTCLLSDNSFNLNHSVTYSGKTQTIQDGVPVNGNSTYDSAYEFYGDGLNTISGNNVVLYTDNAMVQNNLLISSTGSKVYSNYQTRNAGVTRSSSLDLPLSSPQLTPMPVPSGYLGALMFAEHTDYADHDSLRTVIYGTNDTKNPTYGTKGFIGHNLNATWSVFAVSSSVGEGLDSPSVKAITDDMYAHGFEIVPHSIADSGHDYPTRAMAVTYLPWYVTNYLCRNWIDHGLSGGLRNIGLMSCGWDPTSPHYIMDLFQQYNISSAWGYIDQTDITPDDGGLSTSKISSVGLPVDIIWQNTNLEFPDGTPLYQWASSFAGEGESLKWFTNSTIDNMISTYGVCIWHDYWADNASYYLNYYYVRSNPYMINATFDSLLTNISAQKQAGKLWNPTVSQYIDYWIAARNVEVRCTGFNTYTVVNHNSGTLNGFSMRVQGSYIPKLDGVTLSTKTNGEDMIFWMNLPTGMHTITLEA